MALDMSRKRKYRLLGRRLNDEVKQRAAVAAVENTERRHVRSESYLRDALREVGGNEVIASPVGQSVAVSGVTSAQATLSVLNGQPVDTVYTASHTNTTWPGPGDTWPDASLVSGNWFEPVEPFELVHE